MMSQARKYIIILILLLITTEPKLVAFAEGANPEIIAKRRIMEYKSTTLRDPFKRYLVKESPRQPSQDEPGLNKPVLDLDKLKVQGIVWGSKIPQAIINDKVLTIGDSIDGAEIVSIEKNGITLSFNGMIYDLAAPAKNLAQAKIKPASIPSNVNSESKIDVLAAPVIDSVVPVKDLTQPEVKSEDIQNNLNTKSKKVKGKGNKKGRIK